MSEEKQAASVAQNVLSTPVYAQTNNQPPGSGNMANRLIDAISGTTAAATFAGELTLDNEEPRVVLLDAGATATVPVKCDGALATTLKKGNAWVRINLTANELLAAMKLSYNSGVAPPLANIVVTLGGSDALTMTKPDTDPKAKPMQDAIAAVIAAQVKVTNRDEIVSQANDAGLIIARAMKLDVLKHRHFLYLFDVMEFVLARPLYEAKLHFDVARPDKTPGGEAIQPFVPVPAHQSFPSGHASYASAIVELVIALVRLDPKQQAYLRVLAERIASNREGAGLHTSLDTNEGNKLGVFLGQWMAKAANENVSYPKWATLVADAQAEWKNFP